MGVCLDRSLELKPEPQKFFLLWNATSWASDLETITAKQLHRLVGMWTWHMGIIREMLSIFGAVYTFIQQYTHIPHVSVKLWPSVKQELKVLISISPLGHCNLGIPWSLTVLMTDASFMGFGVVSRKAPLDEIKREAQWSEKRGWMSNVDAVYSILEGRQEEAEDETIQRGEAPYKPDLEWGAFSQPVYVFLHLFSGRRRELDLEFYLEAMAEQTGVYLQCISLDIQVDPATGNLSDPVVVEYWTIKIKEGSVKAIMAGPPRP